MVTYVIAAFVISVLAGTGVGGGGLFILYLVSVYGSAQTEAQAVNLIFFICAALSALPYHKRHRKFSQRRIIFCIIFAIAGTLSGSVMRSNLPEDVMRKAFGLFLIVSGCAALFRKKRRKDDHLQKKKADLP